MGLFSSLNKGKRFDFELPGKLPEENYLPLSKMPDGAVYTVRSMYLNRHSKFGAHYVVLAEDASGNVYGVNLPKFNNETVIGIMNNEEMVAAINAGKCGISKGEVQHGENGDYVPTVWVDLA